MKLESFFEKFDQFANAPNAVEKMRELVLELAIQGKLVAQSRCDEPASKQLERIAVRKSKNGRVAKVKAGRSGKSATEETETHLPSGWEITFLAELVTVLNGRAYSKEELLDAGTPVLRVGNLFTSKHWYYSDLDLEPDKYCDKGDLIFAWSASFGPFIWSGPKVIYHYHIWKLESHSEADMHQGYLYWFLQTKTQEIKRAGHGVSMLHMTKEKMEKLEVMFPPLAEQKRIVAKVDELMALCDQLEAQQQERETRHAALARASLARFAEAPTPANLPFLFHPSYAIRPADLRKSILTLAVQGKLVRQDSNDEPVSQLLKRLAALTVEAGKPPKNLLPIDGNSLPFNPPPSWEWVQAQDLCRPSSLITYGVLKPVWVDVGVPTVRVQDMQDGIIVVHGVGQCAPERAAKFGKTTLEDGDLVIAKDGATLGKTAFVPPSLAGGNITQHVLRFPMTPHVDRVFIRLVIDSPHGQAWMQSETKGVALPGVNVGDFRRMPIPLPPVAEQRRIVVKVEHLMALVDKLEMQLAASRATAANLLSALVAELTGITRDGKVAVPSVSSAVSRGRPKESQREITRTTP